MRRGSATMPEGRFPRPIGTAAPDLGWLRQILLVETWMRRMAVCPRAADSVPDIPFTFPRRVNNQERQTG